MYSTCSMNPVEDEAVIATALQLCKGGDYSEFLPKLFLSVDFGLLHLLVW